MKLCVALDLDKRQANLDLIKKLEGLDVWLKIGLRSFIRDGFGFVEEVQRFGLPIFLDLKLYDIPKTMSDSANEIAKMGVEMFNIHASAGANAMKTVMEGLEKFDKKPIVLAVTALTSFDEKEFGSIYNAKLDLMASKMAKNAYESGLDGVVCSAYESRNIKNITSRSFLTLTPGIRSDGDEKGDQARVATPKDAKNELADYIVMGRPIYGAQDPRSVASGVIASIS